jgi:nucleoside-diphosphate-sugar epimerase
MKRVLVTGANGLLGRNLCQRLASNGASLVAVVRSLSHSIGSLTYPLIEVDFTTAWSEDNLPQSIDVVIHLAQSPFFRDFPDRALDVFRVNVESTARLLDYAKRVDAKHFIYASSGGVYGTGTQPFKENAPIVPPGLLGYYLGSKASGEVLVQSYMSIFQVTVIRPFFMYGPGQNRSMLIPRLFDSVANGYPVSLQGADGILINPVHVDDASAAVAAALKIDESATFNIGGPEVLSIREICEGMGRHLGIKPEFKSLSGLATDLIADISAMSLSLIPPKRHLLNSFHDVLP